MPGAQAGWARRHGALWLACLCMLISCGSPYEAATPRTTPADRPDVGAGIPILGAGSHRMDAVEMIEVGSAAHGLNVPRDVALNPAAPDQLWVVNRGDESMVVYSDVGTPLQTATKYWQPTGHHFLAQPAALAFGAPGRLATIHETMEVNPSPPDLMGPTLWPSDLAIFDAGENGHLDMLHNSPLGMGIAWQRDNIYWVFDGYHSSITRYDFAGDQSPDNSDAEIARFVEGQVARVAGVPSHLELDRGTGLLYFADTGHNRIAVLDTQTGTRGGLVGPNYDGGIQYRMDGATLWTLVDGAHIAMAAPSGLALANDLLFVTDNQTSEILAFSLAGELLDWLPTGLPAGSLMGLEVDDAGRIYVVDALTHRVLRIAARGRCGIVLFAFT